MMRRRAAPARLGAAVILASSVLFAGCGGGATPAPARPEPIPTTLPSPTVAVATTLIQVAGALRGAGLAAIASPATVRLGEPPSFAGIPRWPFRVPLPGDPEGPRFLIYEFADADVALAAAADLVAYLASGPGRVQYPPDTVFGLRQVGPTLLFYPWSADNTPDREGASAVAIAIGTVGVEIAVRP